MTYEDYVYRTPDYAKESMNTPETGVEFAEEAARIITSYVRKYRPEFLPTSIAELHIRDLLCTESKLKRKIDHEIRDYFIKVILHIQKPDEQYEQEVLKLYDHTFH